MYSAAIQKLSRHFVPKDFIIKDWASLEPYFKDLLERPIETMPVMEQWLTDLSELEAIINEDASWRQIRMTCDTENKALEDSFNYFFMEIQPKIQPYADALNRKLVDHPLTEELDPSRYFTFLRSIKKSIELFREENIPLQSELAVLQQQYGVITGKMMVTVDGQEYTLQQAGKFLEGSNRNKREEVYRKIQDRRLEDKETLNDLFNQLVARNKRKIA